jgi:hypothetical protein
MYIPTVLEKTVDYLDHKNVLGQKAQGTTYVHTPMYELAKHMDIKRSAVGRTVNQQRCTGDPVQ